MITEVDIGVIYDHIAIGKAAESLKRIIEATESHPQFDWDCRKKGIMYDVRFFHKDDDGQFCYAIVPAKQWLLWYFRKPALEKFSYDIQKLENDFVFPHKNGKVKVNKKDEITIRLFTPSDAQRLIDKYFK